jgi:hypothetical protein
MYGWYYVLFTRKSENTGNNMNDIQRRHGVTRSLLPDSGAFQPGVLLCYKEPGAGLGVVCASFSLVFDG